VSQEPEPPRGQLRSSIRSYAKTAYVEAVLAAAERLFLRDGYHAAKMADIAREAGISVGTLYKHFVSKEAVFESLADRGREEALAIMRRATALGDPKARVEAMVEGLFAHMERQNAIFAILAELGEPFEQHSTPGMCARDAAAEMEVAALVEAAFLEASKQGVLRGNASPRVLAALFTGAVRGALFAWIRSDRQEPLAPQAQVLVALFFEGMTAT